MKKKLLTILLSVAAVFACAFALSGCTGGNGNMNYNLNDDGTGYIASGIEGVLYDDVKIESEYKGKPVTAIAENAFKNCTSLTSVKLENGQQQKILKAANQ